MSPDVRIERSDPRTGQASDLIRALSEELGRRYRERFPEAGDGSRSYRQEQFDATTDVFLLAFVGDVPVGCGALRWFAEGTAEIKRMYVREGHRGLRIGRRLLDALERAALELGYRRLVLETGVMQPEAVALYENAGFTRCPCWAPYDKLSYSLCFHKVLTA